MMQIAICDDPPSFVTDLSQKISYYSEETNQSFTITPYFILCAKSAKKGCCVA